MNKSKLNNKIIRLPYEYMETESYEKGFAEYYQKYIVPLAIKYEEKRIKNQIKNRINIAIAVIAGFAGISFFAKFVVPKLVVHSSRGKGNILLIPPILSWWFFVRRPKRKYFTALKKDIIPLVLKFLGDFNYQASGYLSSEIIGTHTGYYEAINIFPCEDIISYRKKEFYCRIIERTFWDLNKSVGNVFLYFEFADNSGLDIVIFSKKLNDNHTGLNKKLLTRRNLEKNIILGNTKFDQHFKLYAQEQEKTINWIEDDFIDELVYLDNAFNKDGLVFSIKDNQVFATLGSNQNLFEAGTSYNDPTANAADIKNLLKEINFTINLVEIINKRIQSLQIDK